MARDNEAIGRALWAHRAAVRRWVRAFGVSEDEADDAVQSVFVNALARWADYRPGEPLSAWLHGISRRIAANWRRTQRRRPVELRENPAAFSVPSPEARIEARSELRALPERLHSLARAMAEEGSIAGAARALGIDDSTAHERLAALRRARKRAAAELGHAQGCPCWRCAELRGEDDGLAPWRARNADPLTCSHPEDMRHPHSGDSWSCGLCGADVDPPADY